MAFEQERDLYRAASAVIRGLVSTVSSSPFCRHSRNSNPDPTAKTLVIYDVTYRNEITKIVIDKFEFRFKLLM